MCSLPEVGTAPGDSVHSSALTDQAQLRGVTMALLGKPQGRGCSQGWLWLQYGSRAHPSGQEQAHRLFAA